MLASPARRTWLLRSAHGGCSAAAGMVATAALGAGAWLRPAHAHDALGPLTPPRPAPALPLLLHDGRSTHLPALLQGHITALQFMFTGCSATCPVQGAVFGELQRLVTAASLPKAQLLSLSVDPLSDDAAALAGWRRRFGASGLWWAAAPPVRHAQALPDFVGSKGAAAASGDRHSAQVYLFDTRGRLAFRTAELASPRSIAEAMQQLAARSG